MAVSELRQALRASGIKDEDMHFDDGPCGSIIPRLVLQSHEVVVVEQQELRVSNRQAEKYAPSGSLDNRE
jgi:hypothetical protein